MERAAIAALRDFSFRSFSFGESDVRVDSHVSIEYRVDPFDAFQEKARHFDGRNASILDFRRETRDGKIL